MKIKVIIFTLLVGQNLFGQSSPVTFTNYRAPLAFGKDTFYSSRIHEITLNPDSTFEFMSRPHISCFTWHRYVGTWRKENDTLFFYDQYEVVENDVRGTYKKEPRQLFLISFKTDKNSRLRNKEIKVQYVYDFGAHIEDSEKVFNIASDNTLRIPFKVIPHLSQLAALRIQYQLNSTEKRCDYLTQNNPLNIKRNDIPNVISVEFVENPRKEIVHRITKVIIRKEALVFVSSTKEKSTLPDYNGDIEFEDDYTLHK